MGNAGTLEGIVNKLLTPIRISPAGAFGLVGGAALSVGGLSLQISDHLWVRCAGAAMIGPGIGIIVPAALLCSWGVNYYKQARGLMMRETARQHAQRIIEPILGHYCTRNAYHAAARVTGLGEDFRLVNAAYKGPRENRWLPGV